MKKLFAIIFISAILISCKKNNYQNNSGIGIKGTIPLSPKSGDIKKGSDIASSLADAKKVMIFSANTFSHGMYYSIVDISNGAFTAYSQTGFATALVFLDSDNRYIGNLCTQGLNVLPLSNLSDGENTVIDLSTLTLSGNNVLPRHDPFGNEIIISSQEIESLKTADSFYGSLAKNLDTDNDGTPDVLTHSEIVVTTMMSIYGGKWGIDNTKPQLSDTTIMNVSYQMHFQGGTSLSYSNGNIVLTGPAGNPSPNIQKVDSRINPNEGVGFYSNFTRLNSDPGNQMPPFLSGLYTLTLDGSKSYSIYYSNVNTKNNLILQIPTLHTNNGKVISVSLDSKSINGTRINPEVMLSSMLIQFVLKDNSQIATTPMTSTTGYGSYTLPTPIDVSNISSIGVTYDDLLGNRYLVNWNQ
jgi:hypothetical protein